MGSKSKQSGTSVGTTSPTFTGQGQDLLKYMSGNIMSGEGQDARKLATSTYADMAGGGMNPYVEEAIARSNEEGTRMFDRGMAGMRAQGYRGGTAQNLFGQGEFGSTFASRLAGANANTRVGAFDTAQQRRLGAAQGLNQIGATDSMAGLQLLSLLRGESSDRSESGKSSSITGRDVAKGIGTVAAIASLFI